MIALNKNMTIATYVEVICDNSHDLMSLGITINYRTSITLMKFVIGPLI